jgi:hypothetical protein
LPFSAFFRLVLSPSFSYFRLLSSFLLSSTFCRHLLSVTSCLNDEFCRLFLSAFFRLESYAAFCLLQHLAFKNLNRPQPSCSAFSRILLYAAISAFCLLKHSALYRHLPCAVFCLLLLVAFRLLHSGEFCLRYYLPPAFCRPLPSASGIQPPFAFCSLISAVFCLLLRFAKFCFLPPPAFLWRFNFVVCNFQPPSD